MAWNLDTARTVANIAAGDTTHDVALQQIMDNVLGELEDRLGRALLRKQDVDIFYAVDTCELLLKRYPVVVVTDVANLSDWIEGAPITNWEPAPPHVIVHNRVGWISAPPYRHVAVRYEGGFNPLPSGLERAMWEMFAYQLSASNQTTGFPAAGGGAAVIQGSGEISSITIDGMTVRYDVGSTVAASSSGSASSLQAIWGWMAPWAGTLSLYRSESAPGVAIA